MMSAIKYLVIVAVFVACKTTKQSQTSVEKRLPTAGNLTSSNKEPHRPQIHFTPPEKWMNDPNGMVYHNGTYHLFYQYYPGSTVWGPMHWGHATSKNMVEWQHQPVALFPDSLGYIFSGSAVVDLNNTSGFGKDGQTPLVAIFTYHDPVGEKAGTNTFETQGIAYSLDDGKTWTKYANNPVLKNPGIRDFRDPKVTWYEPGKKWIMTLATLDHITFYSSPDLKDWKEESKFGKEVGAHGGVWECPDLFPLIHNGQEIWVLIVNLNPGGPNGGSATQYFTGQFDGNTFIPLQTDTRWLDYGPDEYAGITWSNTGDRKIFLGWMSNWQYADKVPTEKWRSAMTIPRDLGLEKIGDKYLVTSHPSPELAILNNKTITLENILATNFNLTAKTGKLSGAARLTIASDKLEAFTITLSNDAGEQVLIGYDKLSNEYFIDRTNSGKVSFEKGFAKKHTAPRFSTKPGMDMTLIIDEASVEVFADNGLSVMTAIFFPNSPFSKIYCNSDSDFRLKTLKFTTLKSIRR
jgi:fructan beta-fructosidase